MGWDGGEGSNPMSIRYTCEKTTGRIAPLLQPSPPPGRRIPPGGCGWEFFVRYGAPLLCPSPHAHCLKPTRPLFECHSAAGKATRQLGRKMWQKSPLPKSRGRSRGVCGWDLGAAQGKHPDQWVSKTHGTLPNPGMILAPPLQMAFGSSTFVHTKINAGVTSPTPAHSPSPEKTQRVRGWDLGGARGTSKPDWVALHVAKSDGRYGNKNYATLNPPHLIMRAIQLCMPLIIVHPLSR